jgi:hypothetical protein
MRIKRLDKNKNLVNYLPYDYPSLSRERRLNQGRIALRRKSSKTSKIIALASLLITIILLCLAFTYSLDKTIENQDIMLCNSAKKSGNREYLQKCECYYQDGDIACMRGGGQDD